MIIQTKKYNKLILTDHAITRIRQRRNIKKIENIRKIFVPEMEKGKHREYIRMGEEFTEIILMDGSKAIMRKEGVNSHVLISFIDTAGFSARHHKSENLKYLSRLKRARRKR